MMGFDGRDDPREVVVWRRKREGVTRKKGVGGRASCAAGRKRRVTELGPRQRKSWDHAWMPGGLRHVHSR